MVNHVTHLETSYNNQSVNVVLGNVQAYVFYVLCWKSSAKVSKDMRELLNMTVIIEGNESWQVAKRSV